VGGLNDPEISTETAFEGEVSEMPMQELRVEIHPFLLVYLLRESSDGAKIVFASTA
jgi:hypothetical protein